MFDKAITRMRHHFGIHSLEDWKSVHVEWILKMDGVGQATLDHLRLYLAARGVTLFNDETPEYWKEKITEGRIAKTLSYDDLKVPVSFTVLIDSMEQHPFGFDNIVADVTETPNDLKQMIELEEIEPSDVKLLISTKFRALGAGKGDYSILGHQGNCNIERKSLEDAHSTILGWGDRRVRFERELENLAAMDCAAVVVECSLGHLLASAPSHGKKTDSENRKILHRQILSWQQTYRVPWHFCDSRHLAEITTFRILQRYWKKQLKVNKPAPLEMETINTQLANL